MEGVVFASPDNRVERQKEMAAKYTYGLICASTVWANMRFGASRRIMAKGNERASCLGGHTNQKQQKNPKIGRGQAKMKRERGSVGGWDAENEGESGCVSSGVVTPKGSRPARARDVVHTAQ